MLKKFDSSDETIHFDKGRFETISLGAMTIGRAAYQPGWTWSTDVGSQSGQRYCEVEHSGMVVSG